MHKKFDSNLQGNFGKKYHEGVYEMNNSSHVEENQASATETKNLFKFLVNERVMKPKAKVAIGSKYREREWKANTVSEQERIYRAEVKKLKPETIFSLLQIMTSGQEIQNKSNSEIEAMLVEIKKKILSKNYETLFPIVRGRWERMIDEGFTVQPVTQEDKDRLKNARAALSPLEIDYYNTLREDGTYP
jgi:hypothetical protein